MQAMITGMSSWSASHHGIPIIFGEYGCAVEQTNETARLDWYHTYTATLNATSNMLAWSIWDDDGDFKIYDRAANTWDQRVLGALGL